MKHASTFIKYSLLGINPLTFALTFDDLMVAIVFLLLKSDTMTSYCKSPLLKDCGLFQVKLIVAKPTSFAVKPEIIGNTKINRKKLTKIYSNKFI